MWQKAIARSMVVPGVLLLVAFVLTACSSNGSPPETVQVAESTISVPVVEPTPTLHPRIRNLTPYLSDSGDKFAEITRLFIQYQHLTIGETEAWLEDVLDATREMADTAEQESSTLLPLTPESCTELSDAIKLFATNALELSSLWARLFREEPVSSFKDTFVNLASNSNETLARLSASSFSIDDAAIKCDSLSLSGTPT